jgi:hypothetical protein
MVTTIADTYCPQLRCIQPVLKIWIDLNISLFRSWRPSGDVPWWYNERASLSVLSGAVWRTGNEAFEEYSDNKRGLARKTGRLSNKYSGRIDFYFNIKGHEFKGESKFCWLGVSTAHADITERLNNLLSEAKNDARKLEPDDQQRLAIVFATPYVTVANKQVLSERINRAIDQAISIPADAFAWVFPELNRCISYNSYLYPGTMVIIKKVSK